MNKPTCFLGAMCTQTNDTSHTNTFLHPCRHGASCRNQTNQVHLSRYIHPPVVTQVPVQHQPQQPQYLTANPNHIQQREPCSKGFNCTQSYVPQHEQQFLHPCRRGLACPDSQTFAHQVNYYHHYPGALSTGTFSGNGDLFSKQGCPFLLSSVQCTLLNDYNHTGEYYHICPNGSGCTYLDNYDHITYYVHACGQGLNCDYLTDPQHSKYFFHLPIMPVLKQMSTPTSPQQTHSPHQMPLSPQSPYQTSSAPTKLDPEKLPICPKGTRCTETTIPSHFMTYRHVCAKGSTCTDTQDFKHRTYFLHPCRNGAKCSEATKEPHATRFMHPCPAGTKCPEMGNPKHISKFIHEHRDNGGWPEDWEVSIPPSLANNSQSNHYRLLKIDAKSNEYARVKKKVLDSMKTKIPTATIDCIERNENSVLYTAYIMRMQDIALHNSGNPNEKILLHGVKKNGFDAIITSGFSYQLSAQNAPYGMGLYFVDGVNSSQCPPEEDTHKQRKVLLCRVCVGNTDTIPKGGNKVGHRKPAPNKHSHTSHDTNEVVIFENSQAYVEYVITFKGDMV